MRIAHICLAAFYIDRFGYQENVLPRIHKDIGHDVCVIASTETYSEKMIIEYVSPMEYETAEGIKIYRIPYGFLPGFLAKKIRAYRGLIKLINAFRPDFIFVHDFQFFDSIYLYFWLRKNPHVKCVVDTHTDLGNSARGVLSRILHVSLYRVFAQLLARVSIKIWATLPARGKFLKDFYGVSGDKVGFLPFGTSLTAAEIDGLSLMRSEIRREFSLPVGKKLIGLGGKIDGRKNIQQFLAAILARPDFLGSEDVEIVVFGKPVPELMEAMSLLLSNPRVIYLGWLEPVKISRLVCALDVMVFPGSHSVLWEETVGLGCPAVFLKRAGYTHIDLNGNCLLAETVEGCVDAALLLVSDDALRSEMKRYTVAEASKFFSYHKIAKDSISF